MNYKTLLRTAVAVALLCVSVSLGGCSGGDDRMGVSGTVTLDGQPLDNAAINFRPAPGNDSNSAGSGVKDGKFTIRADSGLKPGDYLVKIIARKESGRLVSVPDMDVKVPETVPIKIKENGSLKVTVEPGGEPLQIILTSETEM